MKFHYLLLIQVLMAESIDSEWKVVGGRLDGNRVSTEIYKYFLDDHIKVIDLSKCSVTESGMEQFIEYFDNSNLLKYDIEVRKKFFLF